MSSWEPTKRELDYMKRMAEGRMKERPQGNVDVNGKQADVTMSKPICATRSKTEKNESKEGAEAARDRNELQYKARGMTEQKWKQEQGWSTREVWDEERFPHFIPPIQDTGCSSQPSQWYPRSRELLSATVRKGMCWQDDLYGRQKGADFIWKLSECLNGKRSMNGKWNHNITKCATNTAVMYLHRFFMIHSFGVFDPRDVGTACLYLAAKVLECPRKLDHFLRTWYKLKYEPQRPISEIFKEMDPKKTKLCRRGIELLEIFVLKTLGFDLQCQLPHFHILKALEQSIIVEKEEAQYAFHVATDILDLTDFAIRYRPSVIACVAMHIHKLDTEPSVAQDRKRITVLKGIDEAVTLDLLNHLATEVKQKTAEATSRMKGEGRRTYLHVKRQMGRERDPHHTHPANVSLLSESSGPVLIPLDSPVSSSAEWNDHLNGSKGPSEEEVWLEESDKHWMKGISGCVRNSKGDSFMYPSAHHSNIAYPGNCEAFQHTSPNPIYCPGSHHNDHKDYQQSGSANNSLFPGQQQTNDAETSPLGVPRVGTHPLVPPLIGRRRVGLLDKKAGKVPNPLPHPPAEKHSSSGIDSSRWHKGDILTQTSTLGVDSHCGKTTDPISEFKRNWTQISGQPVWKYSPTYAVQETEETQCPEPAWLALDHNHNSNTNMLVGANLDRYLASRHTKASSSVEEVKSLQRHAQDSSAQTLAVLCASPSEGYSWGSGGKRKWDAVAEATSRGWETASWATPPSETYRRSQPLTSINAAVELLQTSRVGNGGRESGWGEREAWETEELSLADILAIPPPPPDPSCDPPPTRKQLDLGTSSAQQAKSISNPLMEVTSNQFLGYRERFMQSMANKQHKY